MTAIVTGVVAAPPNSRSEASDSTRALWPAGTASAPTGVQFTVRAGSATASITAAVATAITPGRRMTACAMRCQRSSAAADCLRASLWPQSASRAGETSSEAMPATMATLAPARPMDCAKPSGNSVSVPSAAATVAAEKTIVLPAVFIVVTTAACGSAPLASSSRNRVTRNSV